MLTKTNLGFKIKAKLTETKDLKEIAKWAFDIVRDRKMKNLSNDLNGILLTLAVMESDDRFKVTVDEVSQLAQDLIEDKDIRIKLVRVLEK